MDAHDTQTVVIGAGPAGLATAAQLRRRGIPVVVLARVPDPEQTAAAYDAGANTVIAKPVTFLALVKLMKVFTAYWLEAAALPPERA